MTYKGYIPELRKIYKENRLNDVVQLRIHGMNNKDVRDTLKMFSNVDWLYIVGVKSKEKKNGSR